MRKFDRLVLNNIFHVLAEKKKISIYSKSSHLLSEDFVSLIEFNNFFKKKKVKLNLPYLRVNQLQLNNEISVSNNKKKEKIKKLSKKQKKKVKLNKLSKLIFPTSTSFSYSLKVTRSTTIMPFHILTSRKILVHDGYSWESVKGIKKSHFGLKFGQIVYKTRALSPIKLRDKGVLRLDMSQKNTYKIKLEKVKRKK